MKKLLSLALLFALLCTGCSGTAAREEDGRIHILATTYPVYLFTTAITEGMASEEGGGVVKVDLLVNEPVSCLHDYTLTVNDMKAIERADIVIMNGAGLEDFMADALAQTDAVVIDCSKGIELLEACHDHDDHAGHDHEHEYDPHIWMSPANAIQMCANIAAGLSEYEGTWSAYYAENLAAATALMEPWAARRDKLSTLEQNNLITFHDGFQYFAADSGLNLLKSIEEEEGSEASAAEIKEIVALIEEYRIPAIFVEKNGSDSTAQAIARETGVAVYQLDMIMSGDGKGLEPYLRALEANQDAIIQGLGVKS